MWKAGAVQESIVPRHNHPNGTCCHDYRTHSCLVSLNASQTRLGCFMYIQKCGWLSPYSTYLITILGKILSQGHIAR